MKVMGKANTELLFTKSLSTSTRERSGKLWEIGLKQTQASTWLVANIWKSDPCEATKLNGISRFTRGLNTFVDSRAMRHSEACGGTSH